MTKIPKQTKLKAIREYLSGTDGKGAVAKRYSINPRAFRVLIAAYETHGPDVLFNPPKVNAEFRIALASWAIINHTSYTEIAAKFGYTGMAQMRAWTEIYSKLGPNGLLSIKKGRKPKMPNKKPKSVKKLPEQENRLSQLEDEVLRLKIENEALKLLASIQQRTDNSQK